MKKEQKKIISKQWLVLWSVAVFAAFIFFGVYAAYTNINKVKRVVSTQGGMGTAFSSNYLSQISRTMETYDLKRITITGELTTKEFDISVCNYVQNNPSMINENDITYTMTFSLIDAVSNEVITSYDDNESVKVNGTFFSNGVCEFTNQALAGKTQNSNIYTVTVPLEFIDKVNIKVEAVPEENSYNYTDSKKLARIFTFLEYNENTTAWTGTFAETDVTDYDGFNYIVKGQGKGNFTLTWDAAQLEMSQVFLSEYGLTPIDTEDGKKYVVITVDSNEKNRYDIQFYKTENGAYPDIATVKGYVSYQFVESDTASTNGTDAASIS